MNTAAQASNVAAVIQVGLGPFIGAIAALAGVYLSHHFTARRDRKFTEEENRRTQIEKERLAVAGLISAIQVVITACRNLYRINMQLYEGVGSSAHSDAAERYIRDFHLFMSATALASVTIRNPDARDLLRSIDNLVTDMSALVDGALHGEMPKDAEERISRLNQDMSNLSHKLEDTTLEWEGESPSKRP